MAQSSKLSKLTYKQVRGVRQPFNPGSKRHLEAREREVKALDLRKQRYSYGEIGKRLGVTDVCAYYCVMRVLAAFEHDIQERVPQVRQLELLKLDAHDKALSKRAATGDPKAIMTALKVSERRAKLMGLDAPAQMVHSGEINAVVKIADEDLDKEIAALLSVLGVTAMQTPAAAQAEQDRGSARGIIPTMPGGGVLVG